MEDITKRTFWSLVFWTRYRYMIYVQVWVVVVSEKQHVKLLLIVSK